MTRVRRSMDANRRAVARNLKEWRARAGLTQDKLGQLSGISAMGVYKIEAGRVMPSAHRLRNLAIALNKPMDAFFE